MFAGDGTNDPFVYPTEGGPVIDETNILAVGDWSQAAASTNGTAIRGRLLLYEKQHFDGPEDDRGTMVALALQLQECSSTPRPVIFFGDMLFHNGTLHCELRDRASISLPRSNETLVGSFILDTWESLGPRCTRSLRISESFYRWDDVTLVIFLRNGQCWHVPLSKTNEYYLTGTFTAVEPRDQPTLRADMQSAVFTWLGTITLPSLKIPGDYGALTLPLVSKGDR